MSQADADLLVVIPCLNEEAHLGALLEAIGADPACANARIVVADGGSTDASATIARQRAQTDPRIALLHNSARLQSAGVNAAVRAYGRGCAFLVRVDAHAAYPSNYVSALLAAQRESGADAVVVSMRARAEPRACFQEAAACAQNSVLGAGGSPHRKAGKRRFVDHGHHALIKIAAFENAGGYDERFSHNEDAEFDARLTSAGGAILLAADLVIDYFPRATPKALMLQYLKYGQGRARTALKHGGRLKLRQLAAAAISPVSAAGLALAAFVPMAALPALAWLSLTLGYGIWLGVRAGKPCACAAGAAALIMHFAWSVGFLRGLALAGLGRRPQTQRAL